MVGPTTSHQVLVLLSAVWLALALAATNSRSVAAHPIAEHDAAADSDAVVDGADESTDALSERELTEPDQLLAEWDAKIERYPANGRYEYGKAELLVRLSERQRSDALLLRAVGHYKRAAEKAKGAGNARAAAVSMLKAGKHLEFLGRVNDALALAREATELDPSNASGWNDLGLRLLMTGRNEQCQQPFQHALALEPANKWTKAHLGLAYKLVRRYAESVLLMADGIDHPLIANQSRFYYHLGDALQRVGQMAEARRVHERGAALGLYPSALQRSMYNAPPPKPTTVTADAARAADSSATTAAAAAPTGVLRAQPWWTVEETGYTAAAALLEQSWRVIRDEALALDAQYQDEAENLREKGGWKQLTLWAQAREQVGCAYAPRTCELIRQIPAAVGNKRGQIKFSVLHPDTHVWPHTGPTNARLRMHLGLVVPPDCCSIRVGERVGTWEEGRVLVIDDSFEHEVWHTGSQRRIILIVDVWHPDLTDDQKHSLGPM